MVKISPKIEINKEKCIACGACKTACPVSLFSIVEDKSKLTG
ncbi:MAG: 4Fe-4S binding protein, partial [Candidatus Altiarchaeota archaeon]